MILTVQIPVLVPRLYGRYKNRIAHESKLVPIVTRVLAIRFTDLEGQIEADAFIKPEYRGQIEGARSKWIDEEYRRCVVFVDDNPKTLATFLASGDFEWDVRND